MAVSNLQSLLGPVWLPERAYRGAPTARWEVSGSASISTAYVPTAAAGQHLSTLYLDSTTPDFHLSLLVVLSLAARNTSITFTSASGKSLTIAANSLDHDELCPAGRWDGVGPYPYDYKAEVRGGISVAITNTNATTRVA